MPEITSTTPTTSITIAGNSFLVPQPYAAGAVLTSNEADALNQVFAENIRNNQASKLKALIEAGTYDQDVAQGQVTDYASEYSFGVRTGGGRTTDPVQAEAMALMRDQVRRAIVKANQADPSKAKLSDVSMSVISKLAKEALDSGKYPQILDLAKQRVAASQEIPEIAIDSSAIETPAAAESEGTTEATEQAPRGRKAASA